MQQSVKVSGNHGLVNTQTSLTTAWNSLINSTGAAVLPPTPQGYLRILDSKGNTYTKYIQNSQIPPYTLVGTIAIYSGPDAIKKVRFTIP